MQLTDNQEGAAVEVVEETNPVETVQEAAPDFAGDALAALEGDSEESAQEAGTGAVVGPGVDSEEADEEERQLSAQMMAAGATGGIATGVEFFIKGANVTEQQRLEFYEALYPVLAKNDGAMPPWLAKILADWMDELKLARKVVAIGWAIKDQVKEDRAKEIVLPAEMPGPEKQRVRVPKEETSKEAA